MFNRKVSEKILRRVYNLSYNLFSFWKVEVIIVSIKLTKVEQLKPGMIVAEDVFDRNGHLIISHELQISERLIMRLRMFSVQTVKVYEQVENEYTSNGRPRNNKKVINSLEFQEFKKTYSKNVEEYKETINDIVYNNKPIEKKAIIDNIETIFEQFTQKNQIFNMIRSMKQFDDSTYTHSFNVAIICKIFGIWLNKSQEDIDNLVLAGLLHDIGKVEIPLELLNKTSMLTEAEYGIIKNHTKRGYDILKERGVDEAICKVALEHHERRNGSGYPNSLKGDSISEYSQIVAIADTYDAMTARRTYRLPFSPFRVLEYFQKEGYDLFEAKFLLPFIDKTSESCLYKSVTLNNGVEGEVIMLNERNISRPLIRTQYGFIDLAEEKELEIEEVL